MALTDNAWYVDYGDGSTTGHYAVAKWATGTVTAAGAIVRQKTAPAVGSERCFICVVAGTTHATTEPTWTLTRGAKTTDNTVTWQECTGIAAINGDVTNTPGWTTIKNTAITLGQVIKRDSAASFQICTTAGTAGNGAEPSFSNTAGTTTADNTVTWTSLGVVGNFTGWQAPHARISNACTSTWGQAGNKFFVASEHAETRAGAISITPPATTTAGQGASVLCVAKTPVPPTATTTGATVTTTGANAITLSISGASGPALYDGISFTSGAGFIIGTVSSGAYLFKNCSFSFTSASVITVPNTNAEFVLAKFNGCTFTYPSAASAKISAAAGSDGRVVVQNCTFSFGATKPTTVFSSMTNQLLIEGCDFSALPNTSTVATVVAGGSRGDIIVKDCKITSGMVPLSFGATSYPSRALAIRCDSGGAVYNDEFYDNCGTKTIETTIVRTGGATDGVTPISWKIVTASNAEWRLPHELPPIRIWNSTTSGNTTVTIYGIWGGGAVPNNDDIWMDVEYFGTSSGTLGAFSTGTKASILATGSALSSDGSTWGGSTTAFKMTATIPIRAIGYVYIYIKAAAASSTFYIDPKPVIT